MFNTYAFIDGDLRLTLTCKRITTTFLGFYATHPEVLATTRDERTLRGALFLQVHSEGDKRIL